MKSFEKEIMDELNNNSDAEICASLDKKFHYKIAQASGNNLISTIMFSISSLIEEYIENSKIHTFTPTSYKNIFISIKINTNQCNSMRLT